MVNEWGCIQCYAKIKSMLAGSDMEGAGWAIHRALLTLTGIAEK